jgi:hypothetical protein
LRLLEAVDAKLAKKLANAVFKTEPPDSKVKKVAEQVAEEAVLRGNSFAVVGSYLKFQDAVSFAQKINQADYKYKPDIYLAENDYYAVTLGGYLSYHEAMRRVEYAKSINLAKDAYVFTSQLWGLNLFNNHEK